MSATTGVDEVSTIAVVAVESLCRDDSAGKRGQDDVQPPLLQLQEQQPQQEKRSKGSNDKQQDQELVNETIAYFEERITSCKESINEYNESIDEMKEKVRKLQSRISIAESSLAHPENLGEFLAVQENMFLRQALSVQASTVENDGALRAFLKTEKDRLAQEEEYLAQKDKYLADKKNHLADKKKLLAELQEEKARLMHRKIDDRLFFVPHDSNGTEIAFTKWESINLATGQPFKVDQDEFKLSGKRPGTVLPTKNLSAFFGEQYGTFPSVYFVRQEEIKLWEIMLNRVNSSSHTAIFGSSGVGKSIFLMLLGFHMALVQHENILIFRKLKTQGLVYLYLDKDGFARGKVSKLSDFEKIGKHFRDACLLLDGFHQMEVDGPIWILNKFNVLATSCFLDIKSNDPTELFILPAWRLADLQAYAKGTGWVTKVKICEGKFSTKVLPMLVELQYFYSGGSMREFCREHEACRSRCESVVEEIPSDQKCRLLSYFGQLSLNDVNQIFHRFIEDITNLDHYQSVRYWNTLIDSGHAIRWLQFNRQIGEVHKLYQYAKTFSAVFHGSAFECLFHDIIWEYHKTHKIVLLASDGCPYSHVELEIDHVCCSGKEFKECHENLKSLSVDTYWYPYYPYLPFIDCVCRCRLVHKSGHIEETFGCIQVTVATKKVFRPHRMLELEKIKQSNSSFRGYESIYLVVTPSKAACDSFQLVQKELLIENGMDEYDLSDLADECAEDDEGSRMEVHEEEDHEDRWDWKQIITYLDPDSVYRRKDGVHLVRRNTHGPTQKMNGTISTCT